MRLRSISAIIVFSFLFLGLSAGTFRQQVDSATIVGTALDPSGGAVVTVMHLATNSVTDVCTDERGQ